MFSLFRRTVWVPPPGMAEEVARRFNCNQGNWQLHLSLFPRKTPPRQYGRNQEGFFGSCKTPVWALRWWAKTWWLVKHGFVSTKVLDCFLMPNSTAGQVFVAVSHLSKRSSENNLIFCLDSSNLTFLVFFFLALLKQFILDLVYLLRIIFACLSLFCLLVQVPLCAETVSASDAGCCG